MEVGVDIHRDTFSGREEGGNNEAARIVRFMDFAKEVKGWGLGFGIEEKGCHLWISLGEDQH